MIESNQLYIQNTKNWIRSFVISLNLCPFAKREMDKDAVRFHVSAAKTTEQALIDLTAEFEQLNSNNLIETSFLILPFFLADFFDYLDFVAQAESVLRANGYEGIYQLASFHPEYCFADAAFDDVTNYTNRSPWPMLHLLRENSVEQAIAWYGDTDAIVENNKACLRKLGLEEVKRLRAIGSSEEL